MAKLGDVYENSVLDAFLAHYDGTPQMYLGLWTIDPITAPLDTDGTVTGEVPRGVDSSYDRFPLDATRFRPAVGGMSSYKDDIDFPQADLYWGVVTHWAILDSDAAGAPVPDDFVLSGRLDSLNPAIIHAGETFRLAGDSWPVYLD